MDPKRSALLVCAAAGAVAMLRCIGEAPIPPLALGPSDGAVDGTAGREAGPPLIDASAPIDASACATVTTCTPDDGCCPSGCTSKTDSDCPVAVCGDGIVEPGEVCDDGNLVNGDGCDPTCRFANTLERISGFAGGPGYADSDAGANVRFAKPGGVVTDGTSLYYADPGGTVRVLDPATGSSVTIAGQNAETSDASDGAGTKARFTNASALAYVDATSTSGEKDLFVLDGPLVRLINVRDPTYPVTTLSLGMNPNQGLIAVGAGIAQGGPELFTMDPIELRAWNITGGSIEPGGPIANEDQILNAANGGPSNNGVNCQSLVFGGYDAVSKRATYYVGCPQTIVRVIQGSGGGITLFAGVSNTAGCADDANPLAATLTLPVGLSVDASGTLYFTDCGKVRKIDANGVATYAGDGKTGFQDATGGDLTTAEFSSLGSTAILGTTLYAVDGPRIRALTSSGTSTLASGSGSRGNILDATGANASYAGILALTTDATGAIYVLLPTAVVKVDPTTGASSLAFSFSAIGDAGPDAAVAATPRAMTTMNGKLYVAFVDDTVWQMGFDGSDSSRFAAAAATELTSDGTNLYFIAPNQTIGELDASGTRSVVCGRPNANVVEDGSGTTAGFQQPMGITYVGNGSLYVADSYAGGGDILLRRVDIGPGSVTTVAGNTINSNGPQSDGVGADASFGAVTHLASDGISLFAVDKGFGYAIPVLDGPTVREMNPTTYSVSTMLGTIGQFAAAPGVGMGAHINVPAAIVFDPVSKHLILADESAIFRVR